MPMRVALVAASTIPISIFISLGLFYSFGIEMNIVTLAALIVTLGMIVDNAIVIIDSYVEKLAELPKADSDGYDEEMVRCQRRQASLESAVHFFKSILTATLAISITFFPFLITTSGGVHDALGAFPWSVTIVLFVSLAVAELVVPFLQYWFVKEVKSHEGTKKFSLLDTMQRSYDWLVDVCFRHPRVVIGVGVAAVVIAMLVMKALPQRLMPQAERNQLAVEIYLPTGTALEKTVALADSIEAIMQQDDRVVSIASFKGMSSPRFHTVYAPKFAGPNYTQFIVNTRSIKATEEILAEYKPKYEEAFPGAYVRFKQLTYGTEANPVEIRLSGNDWSALKAATDSLTLWMRQQPELKLVRNDILEPLLTTRVQPDREKAARLGVSDAILELSLMMRYNSDGLPMATIWQGDYPVNICLKGTQADYADRQSLGNEQLPVYGGVASVPLRQIATIQPEWQDGQIGHRNGVLTTTTMSEVREGLNVTAVSKELQQRISEFHVPEGITLKWGGEISENANNLPMLIKSLLIAVFIIFFLLVNHYKRISMAVLLMVSLALCIIGTVVGILPLGELTMTCFLGIVSLMGIMVRNAIIMYDYADELRATGASVRDAIFLSAKRRMRPIFLTSAAASMGVIPMILGGSSFWAPMGYVIFFGTLVTMLLILTVLPIAYWFTMNGSTKKSE